MIPRSIQCLALLLALAAPASSQKPALTPADYARWESIGTSELSPDGRTFAFTITRVDGDDDLRVHFIGADSIFRPSRKLVAYVLESKVVVHLVKQVDEGRCFVLDLVLEAENMGIILHESADPHQAM